MYVTATTYECSYLLNDGYEDENCRCHLAAVTERSTRDREAITLWAHIRRRRDMTEKNGCVRKETKAIVVAPLLAG
jgi:hypothetical protein